MRHRLGSNVHISFVAAMLCLPAAISNAKPPEDSQKLAPPPKWTADDLNTFFPDARTKLVGTRPDYSKSANVAGQIGDAGNLQAGEKGAGGWSKLIDAETIETEIK